MTLPGETRKRAADEENAPMLAMSAKNPKKISDRPAMSGSGSLRAR